MDRHHFDRLTVNIARSETRREALRRLGITALGLGGIALLADPVAARRRRRRKKKRRGGGGGGGGLDLMEICEPGKDTCRAGLRCDTPTTRHTCSSTVEGVDAWCCVPPGGPCTECECCGDFYCDFGDANPDGACRPNPEG